MNDLDIVKLLRRADDSCPYDCRIHPEEADDLVHELAAAIRFILSDEGREYYEGDDPKAPKS